MAVKIRVLSRRCQEHGTEKQKQHALLEQPSFSQSKLALSCRHTQPAQPLPNKKEGSVGRPE